MVRRAIATVVVLAAFWTSVVLLASLVRPGLEDARLPARVWAFASLLIQTFRFHAGVATLLIAIALLRLRSRRAAFAMLVLGAIGVAPEVRHAWPARGDDPSFGTPIRLLSLNNFTRRENADALLAMIERERPDLIAIQELTDVIDDRIVKVVGDRYPHRMASPYPTGRPREGGVAGIGLYSRWPITPHEWVGNPLDGRLFAADVDVDGRSIRVFPVHYRTPQSVALVAANRRQVAHTLRRIAEQEMPTLVAGDCNWPIGSAMTDAFRAAGLAHVDDRAGWGPRWSWMPRRTLPITRIDHAFVTPHFGVVDSRVLERVQSDHRPILVDLTLK